MANKTLYVGNLPYTTTEGELSEMFAQWGPTFEVRIVEGRGFGFVEIPEENAAAAIEGTNGKPFQGRPLTVSEAKPRRSNEGGGGGRGERRGGGGGGGRDRGRPDRRSGGGW
jgi:RNA recognition motif-containing protein